MGNFVVIRISRKTAKVHRRKGSTWRLSPVATRITIVGLLLVAAATVFAAPRRNQEIASPQENVIQPENYLPVGEARNLIFKTCVQCHDLRNTVTQRKTAAAWKRTVDEMVWRGAPLMIDEAEIVTKYLAASFGPDKPIPDEFKKKRAVKEP